MVDVDKSEVLRNCKTLLRLVNCEAVIDTKDETLFDILFKSHAKKKMLLSWLIQQLYPAECCAMNSFEDLISTFISKQHLPNFLSGKMPILEQYKRWKLIMNVLHHRQRRTLDQSTDAGEESECGTLFDKLEHMWNEKFGSTLNYVGLVPTKETKVKADELQLLLKSVKVDQMRLTSAPVEQYMAQDSLIVSLDSYNVQEETLHSSIDKLNHVIEEDFESLQHITMIRQLEFAPKYQNLDSLMLKDTKNKLQTLIENVGMFRKLIHGVENFQF